MIMYNDIFLIVRFSFMISERIYGYTGSSRWYFKNISGHFCMSNLMGKYAERWSRKYFRNNQNEGECYYKW